MNSLDLRADHRQTQTLSPRLQHAVRLLQMSSLDFAAMLRDTLGRNPFLETDEGDEATIDDAADGGAAEGVGAEPALDDDWPGSGVAVDASSAVDSGDEAANDRDLWQVDNGAGQRHSEDGEATAMELVAAETSLASHLHGQLNLLPLPLRDLALAHAVVDSLDDDGYLRTPLDDLIVVTALDPAATPQEMQIALKRVQSLDPAGVGARSVAECLQLQLPSIACAESRALASTIVSEHLQSLASRDIAGMARRLDCPAARVEQVCDRIRHLDPRPGWRWGSSQVAYVVPDVVAKKLRGQWTVQLNPAVVPRLRLNQVYARLFQRHRALHDAELGAHLQEARWTLRNVEQRFATILDVAQAIVKRQRAFLDYGAMAMKPLGLREIADELGIHESTVSRVTNNKYIATPIGVYELKYFFSRAMISANGSACSGTANRGLIKDIIEAERPDSPLSDADITRQLGEQGLVVARRTVTKYRQLLKIEAVERRRRHG